MSEPVPELYACRLTLRPEQAGSLLPGTGRAVQSAWLKWLQTVDPALAERLHAPGERRPYTCSSLEGSLRTAPGAQILVTPERSYSVRITAWDRAVVAWLAELVAKPPPRLVLHDVPFAVVAADIDRQTPPTTFAALADRYLVPDDLLVERQADVTLQFLAATLFRQSNGPTGRPPPMPFPLPAFVWGGLYDRWPTTSVPLALSVRAALVSRVAIGRFAGESERVLIAGFADPGRCTDSPDGQWVIGYVGRCTYWWPRRDLYLGSVMRLLAAFANYAGVGYGTAYGFGQVRFIE